MTSKLGVTGAGGHLGASVVNQLLERVPSSDIVAITRDPAKLADLAGRGVRIRPGDFNQPAGLAAAFEGVERLLIIPTSDLQPGARVRQHRSAIQAAVAAGVHHIVYISTIGAKPGPEDGIFETHFATDQALIGSGAAWTILRMGPYAEILIDAAKKAVASGVYSALAGAPAAYVVRDDIAAAAAGILRSKGHAGATYHATGPVSLTQEEVAETIAKVAGTPVQFRGLSTEQHTEGLVATGLPPALAAIIVRFQSGLRDGVFDLVSGDIGRLAGKPAESPADFLAKKRELFALRAKA
jgi:NAD(P)H dehydrogenase (quinone)